MLNTKEEIENWLNKYVRTYEIKNFVINDDLTVDVNGSINLACREIEEFPFKFGIIRGDFYCSDNKLKSLKNSPNQVKGCFNCSDNNLTSLKHCPEKIGDVLNCCSNKLLNLEYLPLKVRYLSCHDNNIAKESLSDFNSDIKGDIISDFGSKEDFLFEVKKQKSLKEKEELTKKITLSENSQLIKKRL